MIVEFVKNWKGTKKGHIGSLPDRVAKRRIEDGVCKEVKASKKGKGETP